MSLLDTDYRAYPILIEIDGDEPPAPPAPPAPGDADYGDWTAWCGQMFGQGNINALPDFVLPGAWNSASASVWKPIKRFNADIYKRALYNLAACFVVSDGYAASMAQTDPANGSLSYWYNYGLRCGANKSLAAGIVSSAGDQGTHVGMTIPDSIKKVGMSDLYLMNIVPFGPAYIAIASSFGVNQAVLV